MPSPAAAVDIDRVSYRFGGKPAVDDLSLQVAPASIFGLLGPNGAGKTTTIRMLVTILKPNGGRISVFGTDVARSSAQARRMFGYVPQSLSADGSLTVRENVSLFARLFDVPRSQRRHQVSEVIDGLGLSDSGNMLASKLSGGVVRRLELAQALISKPRLLVLDEPTVGLDPIARDQLWQHIRRLRDELGMTVLLTTHYMEEADALCDTIALMHKGRLRVTGTPADLKADLGTSKSLDDVFRHYAGEAFDDTEAGDIRSVRNSRRTARRMG